MRDGSPKTNSGAGFSLVEMAIVLVIIGLLVGGMLMPLSAQVESGKIKQTLAQLDGIQEALVGFAMVTGRLPCPATAASAGVEVTPCIAGNSYNGLVPAVTLGLSGNLNTDTLIEDAWGSPLRYSVAPAFTSAITWASVADLVVCNDESASATLCDVGDITLNTGSPAVVYSIGRNWNDATSWGLEETENVSATTLGGGPSGNNYPVADDKVFTSLDYGQSFDDLVVWLSKNIVFNRLISAGKTL